MLRALFTVVLPIALPLLIYLGYLKMTRRGIPADGAEGQARAREETWLWIGLAGAALLLTAAVTLRLATSVPRDATLVAPRLIDGQVVPGHVVE